MTKRSRKKNPEENPQGLGVEPPVLGLPECPAPQEAPDNREVAGSLQAENLVLRDQLGSVVATAASNERIWRHFAEIERILFRTRDLEVLVEELLREIRSRFQPDQVVLLLCHPDILERFFPDRTADSSLVAEGAWNTPWPLERARRLFGESPRPLSMVPETVEAILEILPPGAECARSGVLIPLCIHDILFGGLFLGSRDPQRYQPEDATDLLEQLAVKVAICMENCLTYERLKDFAIEDRLTGLLSFFQIHTLLEREFRKAFRNGTPLSVLIIDPVFVHEAQGHLDIGARVLRHVAQLLSDMLPEGDSFLGRYGGDEFLLVLPNVQEEEAREVVPYLAQAIRKKPFRHENTAILIQALISVGSLGDHMKRSQDLLDSALSELCNLKMSGRDPSRAPDQIAS
jgi:diguanylate cyclase (GGDEF)-like protein